MPDYPLPTEIRDATYRKAYPMFECPTRIRPPKVEPLWCREPEAQIELDIEHRGHTLHEPIRAAIHTEETRSPGGLPVMLSVDWCPEGRTLVYQWQNGQRYGRDGGTYIGFVPVPPERLTKRQRLQLVLFLFHGFQTKYPGLHYRQIRQLFPRKARAGQQKR